MRKLWVFTAVLLVGCLSLAVTANPTQPRGSQQTQQKEEQQSTPQRIEIEGQRGQGRAVEVNRQQGRRQEQQVTEGEREITQGKQRMEEGKDWGKQEGREGTGEKQQEEEGKGEKDEEKQHIREGKEEKKQQTREGREETQHSKEENGEKTQKIHQPEDTKQENKQVQKTAAKETEHARQKGEEEQQEEERDARGETTREAGQRRSPKKQRYRFLVMFPLAVRSHSIFYSGVINALVNAGHHVTVVAPHNTFQTSDQVRAVVVKEGDLTNFSTDALKEDRRVKAALRGVVASIGICSDVLARPEVQDLAKEEFDMVLLSVTLCDCFLSLVHQLKVPYGWLSPVGLLGSSAHNLGSPQFPSFMGTKHTFYAHPLAFHQRLFATLMETNLLVLHGFLLSSMESECRQRGLCPPDMPSIQNVSRAASLIIHNCVRPLELPARPAVAQEIYAGGIQCRPAQPLPQELEAWVQGAGEAGFIFFSLGSVIKGSGMSEETRAALLEAFGSLEQRVLWKWDEDTMTGLPPNVRLAKWLPQQDLLGHPRLRLFITHGGLMSTMEASYHGAPVLGLPVFADQHTNMELTQVEGWGRYLDLRDATKEALLGGILGVMNDPDIQATAKRRAVLMRDQPMTPADTLVFWAEYVIRHNGAPHLRCPAADMPWYQLYNVDVWATVAAVVAGTTYLWLRLMAAVWSCLCGRRSGKRKTD